MVTPFKVTPRNARDNYKRQKSICNCALTPRLHCYFRTFLQINTGGSFHILFEWRVVGKLNLCISMYCVFFLRGYGKKTVPLYCDFLLILGGLTVAVRLKIISAKILMFSPCAIPMPGITEMMMLTLDDGVCCYILHV